MSHPVRPLLPYAEAALVLVSLSAVAGFGRLFNAGSWLPQLVGVVLVAHGLAIVTRRIHWPIATALAVSVVALAITIGLVLYPSTTAAGVPTASTLNAVRTDLGSVWSLFQSVQAPTAALPPFVLVAALALWWAAFVSDWAAFRLWIPFEAVVPAGTVFVFASIYAAHRNQVAATAFFLLAAFGFVLVHRVTQQQASGAWVSTDVQRGTNSRLRTGGLLIVGAVLVGVVAGPRLPQAHSGGVVNIHGDNGGGGGSRTTISPLVEIRKRLTDQSPTELFTVTSDQRSYWRLTSLDVFDGDIWSSNGSYENAKGTLPREISPSVQSITASQTFNILDLSTIWLPAAFEPKAVNAPSLKVTFASDSDTLIVGTGITTSDNSQYSVQSVLPLFSAQQLSAATGPIPAAVSSKDLELPPDFSPRVAQEARRVVAGANGPYQQALALQNYFRTNFTYDATVDLTESSSAMETFLFDLKRGYCEQFAGTYAAMARSIGLPTRVAVGFTPGDADPTEPGVYHVKGLHAHAWPEVYFAGIGWVPFEPTPGRGAPNAEQYTGVPESQAADDGGVTTAAPTTVVAAPVAPTTSPNSSTQSNSANRPSPNPSTSNDAWWSWSTWTGKLLWTLVLLVFVAGVYAVSVPVYRANARRRRREAARSPSERAAVAWQESIEIAPLRGVVPRPSETPQELGWRARETLGIEAYAELAALVSAAAYSPSGIDEAAATRAVALAAEIDAAVRAGATRAERVRFALDPRPVERRTLAAPTHHALEADRDAPPIELVDR